jgi:rhomboid protease GluP
MTPAPVGHHCPACVAEGQKGARRIRLRVGTPRSITVILLGINIAVFVLETALGGSTDIQVLVRLGAMVPILVAQGEYWRPVTAMFLHVGLLHLALNSLGLYLFGNLVESAFGSARFLAIYLVSGLCASVASFTFGSPLAAAAGASGAVFGLLGAWLAYNLRRRQLSLAQANIQGAIVLIGINLAFGFVVPGIDNLAHIGGLATGVGAGFFAEGAGRGAARRATAIAGMGGLVAAAGALAMLRAASLTG